MYPLPRHSSFSMLQDSLPKVFEPARDDAFRDLLRALDDGAATRTTSSFRKGR
ncbi:hypothetical protein [Parafrankia sp. BMG5.11]|uniref:hypothetical protein n=1 Tax=Parafrankia sp. BMG5.11 TaxID=222540 RepID=UPI0014048CB1|nr:hypothetical protein [Parafrankia sp. BMG5.11]